MDRKSLKQAPIYVRDAYNHAIKQAPSDLNGAIQTLVKVVREYPEVAATREKLREFELAKARGMNPLVRAFWMLLSPIPFLIIKIKAIRDPYGALSLCEGPLSHCVDNPLILLAMADAGEDCEAMFISAEALEIFHEFHPANEGVARRMAEAFQRDGRAREALKVLQEISKRHPADLSMQAELRSAIALASIERGKWEEEGTTQSKAADAKAAVTQQLMDQFYADAESIGEDGHTAVYADYEIVTNTDQWFTLKLSVHLASGSGTNYYVFYNVDRSSDQIVTLGQLFTDDSYADVLRQDILAQMKQRMEEDPSLVYWTEDSDMGQDFIDLQPEHNYYFDDAGNLVIPFDEYEVAPGSVMATGSNGAVAETAR